MNDYSEVTATLNRDVTELIKALNDKKWAKAFDMANGIQVDMGQLSLWIALEMNKK